MLADTPSKVQVARLPASVLITVCAPANDTDSAATISAASQLAWRRLGRADVTPVFFRGCCCRPKLRFETLPQRVGRVDARPAKIERDLRRGQIGLRRRPRFWHFVSLPRNNYARLEPCPGARRPGPSDAWIAAAVEDLTLPERKRARRCPLSVRQAARSCPPLLRQRVDDQRGALFPPASARDRCWCRSQHTDGRWACTSPGSRSRDREASFHAAVCGLRVVNAELAVEHRRTDMSRPIAVMTPEP